MSVHPIFMRQLLDEARLKMPYFRTPSIAVRTRNWFMFGDPNFVFPKGDKVKWVRYE